MARRLTLADALALAEAKSGLVRRAHAERMSVASANVGASLLLPANPVLAVGAGPRRETDMGRTLSGTQLSAHLEQTLEIAGQRGTRRDVVARQVEAADWREQVARAETRARVRAAYVGAQIAEAQLRSVGRRLDLVRRLVEGVRTRVETGAASDVEFELARVERGRALRQQIAAQLSVKEAYAELGLLLGEPAGTTFDLATPLHQPPVHTAPLAVLIDRARTYRAELKSLTASRRALDAELVRVRRESVPNPTLFVDFQRDLPGQTYIGGGVALPLPLWRRTQGERAIVRAEQSRLEEENDIAGREIATEVERAYRAYGARRRDGAHHRGRHPARGRVRGGPDHRGVARGQVRPVPRHPGVARSERRPTESSTDPGGTLERRDRPGSRHGSIMKDQHDTTHAEERTTSDEPQRPKRRFLAAASVLGAVAIVVGAALLFRSGPAEGVRPRAEEEGLDSSDPDSRLSVLIPEAATARNPIKLAKVSTSRLAGDIQVVGNVSADADHFAIVGPLVAGRVTRLVVGVGSHVKRGQIMAEIESAEVGDARAALLSAKARLSAADANLRRERELADKRISSAREREIAEAQWATEKASVRAAEERLRAIGLNEGDIRAVAENGHGGRVPIRAPIDGAVIERPVTLGEAVERATDAFRIADLDPRLGPARRLREGSRARPCRAAHRGPHR